MGYCYIISSIYLINIFIYPDNFKSIAEAAIKSYGYMGIEIEFNEKASQQTSLSCF